MDTFVKAQSGLKLVPWESWQAWNEVREAVFSSVPSTVSAALTKENKRHDTVYAKQTKAVVKAILPSPPDFGIQISAWRARNSLPVAVEVTKDLVSIQMTDPFFSECPSLRGSPLTDEMLCLMYAMAIMRLVNGVVDLSRKQNSSSVALRAQAAGLPRILVDIRHEVAHKELPSISYLRLASKQALEWLKSQYWEAQKQVLDEYRINLKTKLYAYASLAESFQSQKTVLAASMKECENELVKLTSSAVPDMISILVEEGLLLKCVAGNDIWRHVISKLCSRIPQLLKEVISWSINLTSEKVTGMELVNFLMGHTSERRIKDCVDVLTKLSNPPPLPDVSMVSSEPSNQMEPSSEQPMVYSDDLNTESEFEKSSLALAKARKLLESLCGANHARNSKIDVSLDSGKATSGKQAMSSGEYRLETENTSAIKGPWSIAQTWRPCAIGMLPSALHTAGVLPCLRNVSMDSKATYREEALSAAQNQPSQQNVAAEILEVENKNDKGVQSEHARLKRNASEDEFVAAASKRIKADTCSYVEEVLPDTMPLKVDYEHDSIQSVEKESTPLAPGFLFIDGLYQRCGFEQLACIQSSIHIFK